MDKYQITINTFDKLAEQYQDKYMDFEFYQDSYDQFCQLLNKPDASILELGCGPGNITRYILNQLPALNIFATDLAPRMIELAKANNPGAKFAVMDSRDISQISERFDAMLVGFCLPYLQKNEAAKLINDAVSLLKPDGLIHLSTMEDSDEQSCYQTSSSGDRVYIHYHQSEYLIEQLEKSGFEILKLERKQFPAEAGVAATDLFIYARLS